MSKTHTELFQNLVMAGAKMRYGLEENDERETSLPEGKPAVIITNKAAMRVLLEMRNIIDNGFEDYYLMAFTLFRHNAASAGIGYWARGAVPSSVVCYCLGLTEIDPIEYGLHYVRFVNDELPKFQFDIEASRYDEFMKMAEDVLQASAAEGYDIEAIREGMLQRLKNLTPMEYLRRKRERPLPENIDDELARYALSFPDTKDLYDAYVQNPQSDLLIYQEEMLDILRQTFRVSGIKANQIRLSIQRGDAEQVEAYKQELFSDLKGLTPAKARAAWQRLTSNSRAFLKAHAVSHVLASYKYEF